MEQVKSSLALKEKHKSVDVCGAWHVREERRSCTVGLYIHNRGPSGTGGLGAVHRPQRAHHKVLPSALARFL
jgi:hypothetical protein